MPYFEANDVYFFNSGVECRLTSEALDKVLKNGVDGVGSGKAGSGGVVAAADASNGFHPVSKDVNRFVSSLFSPDTVDRFDHSCPFFLLMVSKTA